LSPLFAKKLNSGCGHLNEKDFNLNFLSGYSIVAGGGGGIHGRPEEDQITLILAGVGVQQGLVGGEARIIDVVPKTVVS